MEGCAFGIPSIGFSLTDHSHDADFTPCYKAIDLLVKEVLEHGLPEDICLNVNVPNIGSTPEEMRLAVACRGRWNDEYINEEPENEKTDEWCLSHDIISVVPVCIERTAPITSDMDWLKDLSDKYNA